MKAIRVIFFILLPAVAFAGPLKKIQNFELAAGGIRTFEVNCGAGKFELRGEGQRTKIKIRAEIEVDGVDQEEFRQFIEEYVDLGVTKKRRAAVLQSQIKGPAPKDWDARINLTIRLPPKMNLILDDGSGSIYITGIFGKVLISDDSGRIQIESIHGKLSIHDGSGAIEIDGVDGKVEIHDGSGSITIDDVNGDVVVVDGSGPLTVQHVSGNLTVSDGSGSIDISGIEKNVFLREVGSGEVNVERVKGKVTSPVEIEQDEE